MLICIRKAMSKNSLFALTAIFIIFLGFGTYRISESPATWADEGMIGQLSINLATHGVMGIQSAPGIFESGAFMSVGFPYLFPLASIFKVFGVGILQARFVTLAFGILFLLCAFSYIRKEFGMRSAIYSGLLVVTFPPFYVYAKNILGEVPGLSVFLILLLLLWRYEKIGFPPAPKQVFVIGLVTGLCIVTKPVFIPLLGALVISAIWSWWRKVLFPINASTVSFYLLGFALPVVLWMSTQFFAQDSFHSVLTFYANPYNLTHISSVMLMNFLRFFQESAPLYLAFVWAVWAASFVIRERRGISSTFAEKTAFTFTCALLFFYLRTPGWYKYFFIPQIITLLYFPASLSTILSALPAVKRSAITIVTAAVVLLAGMHAYLLMFSSFIEESYHSTRNVALETYFKDNAAGKNIFIHRAPETVIFLPPNTQYEQYTFLNKFSIGESEVARISSTRPDMILTSTTEGGEYYAELFPGYALKEYVDRYAVLVRIPS